MIATVLTMPQRSPEWFAARLGRITGSSADAMLAAPTKTRGEAAGRRNLRVRLILERVTGLSQEDVYVSKDMQRGIDEEENAFRAYEAETGELVRRSGFLMHPTLMAGCSLDGQIGNYAGIIELKVPKSATHMEYLRGDVPLEYLRQCQHNLWMSEAAWCDFVSYDPRFPEGLRLKITRITMSETERKAYELVVRLFLGEVDREVAEVEAMARAAQGLEAA